MLGSRTACKGTGSSWPNGAALSRPACGPAIEDRLAALNSAARSRCRSHGSNIRRFVDWPRSGLRHHHAARRQCGGHPALAALRRRACWRTRRLCGNGGYGCCSFRRGRRGLRSSRCGRCTFQCGCRCRRLRNRERLGRCWLLFARGRSRGRLHCARRRWRNHHHRARSRYRACGWLGHHGARRWAAGNGRRSCGCGNNRRCLPRLRNNFPRFRACRCGGGSRGSGGRGVRHGLGRLCRWGGRLCRHARVTRFCFLFLLLGQNGLHHIAGLGDVRKIDLGNHGWRALPASRGAM